MKRLILCAMLLATPANATAYVINLDTGYFGSIPATVDIPPVINDNPPVQPIVPDTGLPSGQCGIEEPVCLVTPLPGTLILFATGLAGLGILGRKRRRDN